MRVHRIWRAAFLVLLLAPGLSGQSASKTLERLAREQENIRIRLERILEKMDRLMKRNELDGRQHTADLIRRAKAEILNRDLLKRIERLDAKIRAAQLTVEGEQRELIKDLEDVFAILQDRTDMEQLQDLIQAYTEGLRKIGRFVEEQDGILKDTRRLTFNEKSLLTSARKRVEEIIREQKIVNTEVAEGKQAEGIEEAFDAAEALETLAESEEKLAEEAEALSASDPGSGSKAEALGREQERLAEHLEETLKRIRDLAEGKNRNGEAVTVGPALKRALEEASETADRAGTEMRITTAHLKEAQLQKAGERARSAQAALSDAAGKIRRAGGTAYQENRRQNMAHSDRQDRLRRKMEEVKDGLERLETLEQDGAKRNKKDVDKGNEILGEMEGARDQLSRGHPEKAGPFQERALGGLEELKRSLQEREDAAPSERTPDPKLDQSRREEFQKLAERQKRLEEQVRDLMRRLRDLPDQKPIRDLADAADNMSGASEELSAQLGEEAEVDEEEAKENLEKALDRMKQEEDKYQSIRQQEILFRVQQVLEKLKIEQDKINMKTAEFDAGRGDETRITRLKRRELDKLSQREEAVRAKTLEVKAKIEEDASTVFSWILERNAVDLQDVVNRFRKRETGPLVQLIQADVSRRFAELLEALKLEMKRRMDADKSEPSEGGPDQRPALIPPVAELLMIKKMEENALRDLEDFVRMNPDMLEEGADPVAVMLLERLGHRHVNITELFEKMLERAKSSQPGSGR